MPRDLFANPPRPPRDLFAGSAPQQPQQAQARQMGTPPPLPATRNTGFNTQVSQALARSGMDQRQSVPIPTEQEFAQGFKDYGVGRLQGAPAQVLGVLGDAQRLVNMLPSYRKTPEELMVPGTTGMGNLMFGQPKSNLQAFGRATSVEGPLFLAPAVKSAVKTAARGTGALAQHALGATTGAGRPAIQEAVRAGRQGGQAAETFAGHMRGNIASDEAVRLAKGAVEELRAAKSQAYRQGIGTTIKGDPTVLNFQPIEDAINRAADVKMFKGQSLSTVADKARLRIGEVIAEWKGLNPAEFHTPEGLDALKQKLGDLIHEGELSSIKPNSPAAIIVNNAYNAVKDQIVKQAPGYAKVMKDYMQASDQLREVEKTFSLGNRATADTGLRKLQSIFRNNANTNYGMRAQLGAQLAEQSPELMPALAGQALNSAIPRGIMGPLTGAGGLAGATAAVSGAMHPGYLAALPATSPRVVGEAAFAAGNMRRLLADALKTPGVLPGGGAGIGSIDPRLLAQMSPKMLNQLILNSRAPAQQQ